MISEENGHHWHVVNIHGRMKKTVVKTEQVSPVGRSLSGPTLVAVRQNGGRIESAHQIGNRMDQRAELRPADS